MKTQDELTKARQDAARAWSAASLEYLRAKRNNERNVLFLKVAAQNAKTAMKAANEAAGYGD